MLCFPNSSHVSTTILARRAVDLIAQSKEDDNALNAVEIALKELPTLRSAFDIHCTRFAELQENISDDRNKVKQVVHNHEIMRMRLDELNP